MSSVEQLPAGPEGSRDRYMVNSLARGLSVLECFLEAPAPLRLKELVEKLHVEKATLFRYCVTLQEHGYLELDPLTKEYRLGPKVRELGMAARRQLDLLGVIRAWLPVIAERYQGTASFGVLAGAEVVYVDRAVTEGSLSYSLSIGARLPVQRSSIGKALLAALGDAEREAVLATISDARARKALAQEIAAARAEGFALNLGGSQPGVNSVAVELRDFSSGQVVGALNVAANASQFPAERLRKEVGPHLLEVAERIRHNQPPAGPNGD
ncbi:MAG TPA: IclR family transcriptional regulator [Conexibacter sp.]|nr:IclR family transcriptional regulator [Conexibacter sp.]